jgi:hypothetical protein
MLIKKNDILVEFTSVIESERYCEEKLILDTEIYVLVAKIFFVD